MRYATAFCLLVLLSGHQTQAQVSPSSSGGCTISASGLMDCDWASVIELQRTGTKKTVPHAADERQQGLFVTRCILEPGAPLNPLVNGREVLIVGMNDGELINEKMSPQKQVSVTKGLVMLMPKKKPYLLRNVGKASLDLLVVEVRK